MAKQDVLVLVPGLFGFDSFGQPPEVRYFDQVAVRLATYTGWGASQIVTHRPPPTGALCWRVKTLYDFVTKILREGLPGVPEIGRIHLIGHSTGGVDVRLLLNEKYAWPNPPSAEERARLRRHIGQVISISAPHGGTPIARRLRGAMENAIPLLYVLSILGKVKVPPSTMAQVAGIVSASLLETAAKDSSKTLTHAIARALPPSLVGDVTRFLDNITDDHALIHDLTPIAMARLNEAIAGADPLPISCYVTVAPPSTLKKLLWKPSWPVQKFQETVYTIAYQSAQPSLAEGITFPEGPWVQGGVINALRTTQANDGVVPSAQQVLPGVPPVGIVAGDHLDVVGHFDSQVFRGVSVFKSGSSFDDARFDELWRGIAGRLRASRSDVGVGGNDVGSLLTDHVDG